MEDEDELDLQPVKEVKRKKTDLFNDAFINYEQDDSLKFLSSKINNTKNSKNKLNLNLEAEKENSANRMQKRKLPQVTWEEITSQRVDQHNNFKTPVSSDSIASTFPVNIQQNFDEVGDIKQSELKCSERAIKTSNYTKERNSEERTPALLCYNKYKSETTQYKLQNQNNFSEEHKFKSSEPVENKENEVNDERLVLPLSPHTLDKNESHSPKNDPMKRIHGGKIEASHKDYIRSWKKVKTLVSKHLEQKHPTSEDIISIKRKTLESSKQVGAENVTLSEEMNEFIYLKKQKMNENESQEPKTPSKEAAAKSRHYDQESIRNFMKIQKERRRKAKKIEAQQKLDERKKIEDHLKNIEAARLKERSSVPIPLPRQRFMSDVSSDDYFQQNNFNTKETFASSENPENITTGPLKVETGVQYSDTDAGIENSKEYKEEFAASLVTNHLMKEKVPEKRPLKKRKKKDCKNSNRKLHTPSGSASVTDIVNKALQECQDKLKGTIISTSESEDPEITSETSSIVETTKNVPSSRKERIAALNEMAQRLARTIDLEEKSLENWQNQLSNGSADSTQNTDSEFVVSPAKPSHKKDRPLSLAEIKAMSLEELMARMTATLPKTNGKEITSKVKDEVTFSCKNRPPSSTHILPFNHLKNKNFKLPEKNSKHPFNFDLTSFKPLNASLLGSKNLTLPNFEEITQQTDHHIPILTFGSEDSVLNRTSKLIFQPQFSHSSLEVHAATIIQAYFRGYRVRKTTSPLLAKKIRERKFQKLFALNVPPLIEPTINHVFLNSEGIPEVKGKAQIIRESRDWYYLGKEFEANSKIALPPDTPKPKHSSLPKYIQPFFELTETGDINAFIESCPTIKEPPQIFPRSFDRSHLGGETLAQTESSQLESSQKSLRQKREKNSENKQTQTVTNFARKKFSNGKVSLQNEREEIDLKLFRIKESNRSSRNFDSLSKNYLEKPVSPLLSTASHKSEIHHGSGNIVSENILSQASFFSSKRSPSSPPSEPERKLTSSNIESSSLEVSNSEPLCSSSKERLKENLGKYKTDLQTNSHIDPTNLSMKISTELAYQDTLGCALNHLQDLENLRNLSQAHQKSSDLLKALNLTAEKSGLLGEDLRKAKEEIDVLKLDKREQDQNDMRYEVDVERIKQDAQSRILKFEDDMRKRAEDLFESMARTSFSRTEAIASATAAAVGASMKVFGKLSEPNLREFKFPSSHSDVEAPLGYSQDFEAPFFENAAQSHIDEGVTSTQESANHSKDLEYHFSSEEILTADSAGKDVDEESSRKEGSDSSSSELVTEKPGKESESTEYISNKASSSSVPEYLVDERNDMKTVSSPTDNKVSEVLSSSLNSPNHSSLLAIPDDEEELKELTDISLRENFNSETKNSTTLSESIQDTEKYSDLEEKILSISESSLAHSRTPETEISPNVVEKEGISSSLSDVHKSSFHPDEKKPSAPHTSLSELIDSLVEPVSNADAYSLASHPSSSSSVYENLKNSISAEHSVTHSGVLKSVVDTSGTYSESFEPDSGTSDTSEPSLVRSKLQIDAPTMHQSTLSSESGKKGEGVGDIPSSVPHSQGDTPNKGSALFSTLSLLDSLQKEEEVRLRLQMAVFKLHEKSLVEEARLKLASLNSEGGTNIRKKQRAILLQLREQRTHIRRLVETQNLAAQQRHLIFSQHHQLLSSTMNSSLIANRILQSRVQSPITTRILDLSLSSSDDLDNVSSNHHLSKNLGKSTSDIAGDESKILAKQTEEERGTEEVNKTLDSASILLKEREKLSKKEDKGKYRERHTKPVPAKPLKRITKGVFEDKTEERSVSHRKSTSSSNEECANEKKLSLNVFDEAGSDDTYDQESISAVDEATPTKEQSEESTVSKTFKREREQDTRGLDASDNSHTPSNSLTLSDKAKLDSDQDQVSTTNKFSADARKRKDKTGVPFSLKFPLSPRSSLKQHRRQSSESDDSFTLSQNETASDMSDGEGKLVALKEELALRRVEAEKLKREKRKILRERVYSQELALKNQIAAYDNYIKQTKSEIEKEMMELQNTAAVKPLIKKPRVAGKRKMQTQELSDPDFLEESSINESFPADDRSSLLENSLDKDSEDANQSSSGPPQVETDVAEAAKAFSAKSSDREKTPKIEEKPAADKDFASVTDKSVEQSDETKVDNSSATSLSPDQVDDCEAPASHDTSTETILYSPKKSASLKESEPATQQANAKEDYEQTFTEVSDTPLSAEEKEPTSTGQVESESKRKESDEEETISSEICEDVHTDVSLKDLDVEMLKKDDSTKLKAKADSMADSILESLVSDSVSCMKCLLYNKQKEIGELVVHIEESAEKDLKSENPVLEYKNGSLLQPSHATEAEKPLESLTQKEEPSIDSEIVKEKKVDEINSPIQDELLSPIDGVNPEELASRLMNVQASSSALDDVADLNDTFSVSSCEGKWLEGDFWKAGEKAKSEKELREEEELLNAEIARLEEIQRFKERYPNLIIREVPNKPPPPYTPPKAEFKSSNKEENGFSKKMEMPSGTHSFPEPQTPSNTISVPHRLSKADLRKIASDIINVIPSKLDEVLAAVQKHFDLVYAEWEQGGDPSAVENPSMPQLKEASEFSDDEDDTSERSEVTFHRLIFHLTRELVTEVYAFYTTPPKPIWVPAVLPNPAKPWQVVGRLTKDRLRSHVKRKVCILMGWDSPTARETTMMKWARKKKEHVDQVLVQELQSEELSWTQYHEEEAHVKFQMSQEIFASLIQETSTIFEGILQRKLTIV